MRVFLWTNSDLDGVGTTILLGNIFKNFEYNSIFFGNFEQSYSEWFEEHANEYDKIFIVGMPLTQQIINKFDDKKVVFVSDKLSDLNTHDSKLIQKEYTSCSKLLYKHFSQKLEFPVSIKKLIAIIDDYNSYSLKTSESKLLNGLYRKSGSRRFNNFVNRFWQGYVSLTESETKLANMFYNELNTELENLDLYRGEYKGHSVMATFSKFSPSEVANSILDNYNPDIAIIVNVDTQFVSFRKKQDSKADIKFMAENLCNGGGGDCSSGGKITQKFMEFTSNLTQI